MKIERLETHDRLLQLHKQQALNISQGLEDCLRKNPVSVALQDKSSYIYVFAHPRTHEDGVTKRMLWQPRLTKPKASLNSYLFRVKSNTDVAEICWLLPPRETWSQYEKGKITENTYVLESIERFTNHRAELEAPFEDDLREDICKNIYKAIAREFDEDKQMKQQSGINKADTISQLFNLDS